MTYKTLSGPCRVHSKIMYSGDYLSVNEKPIRLGTIAHSLDTGFFFTCLTLSKHTGHWINITQINGYVPHTRHRNSTVLPAYIIDVKSNIRPAFGAQRFSGY